MNISNRKGDTSKGTVPSGSYKANTNRGEQASLPSPHGKKAMMEETNKPKNQTPTTNQRAATYLEEHKAQPATSSEA